MTKTLKLTYTASTVFTIEDDGLLFILNEFKRVQALDPSELDDAWTAILSKVHPEMTNGQLVELVLGEHGSAIIAEWLHHKFVPTTGLEFRVAKIQYNETPAPLPLPEDATPQVIEIRRI